MSGALKWLVPELAGVELGGAVAGGALAPIIGVGFRRAATDLAERLLGDRERLRVGAVIALTSDEIRQRLDNGELHRRDDFLDQSGGRRSTAEEIAEGVLLAAQREYEESKLPLLAKL